MTYLAGQFAQAGDYVRVADLEHLPDALIEEHRREGAAGYLGPIRK